MEGVAVEVRLSFGDFTLDVAHHFPGSGITAVFGPSGCGKSTLLRVIAGFEKGAVGRVSFAGETWQDGKRFVAPHRRGVGYVFQDARLFNHLDVRRNLLFAHDRAIGQSARYSFDDVVSVLDLEPLFTRRAGQLSGGERQRVAIGRTLLARPRLLLLDEPLSALDAARKAEILPYLESIRDVAGVPMLYVSHSATEVGRLADAVVVLEAGRVRRVGPVAEVLSDPALAPAGPRGQGALLSGRVVARHDDGLTEIEAGGAPLLLSGVTLEPGREVRLRVAAHDVILSREAPTGLSALNVLPGTVAEVHPGDGPEVMIVVATAAGNLLARVTRRSVDGLGLAPGAACHAIMKSLAIAAEDIGTQAPRPE